MNEQKGGAQADLAQAVMFWVILLGWFFAACWAAHHGWGWWAVLATVGVVMACIVGLAVVVS